MDVTVTPAASSARAVVDRLLELNAYEFSRLDGRPIGDDGRYGYRYLDAYWSEPDRNPYLIAVDGELGGLAGNAGATTFWRRVLSVGSTERVEPDGTTTQTFST